MKKLFFLAAGALFLSANLSSCKKGENDPTLSLRSRKARLTGEWTVTSINGLNSQIYSNPDNPNNMISEYIYNGSTQTNTTKDGNGTVLGTSTSDEFTLTFSFKKDGTFTITQKETANSIEMTSSGNWIFLNKNKNSKLKNKEAILLSMTSDNTINNGVSLLNTYSGLQGPNSLIFEIDELKNNQITFIDESVQVDNTNTPTEGILTSTNKTIYTLKQK